jgi:ribosome recycling factor
MAVMERGRWTDERIDDLAERVERGFSEVKGEVRDLRTEMKNGFGQIDKRFERVDDKLDAVQRNMMTWGIALFSTIVSLNAAVIAAIALT